VPKVCVLYVQKLCELLLGNVLSTQLQPHLNNMCQSKSLPKELSSCSCFCWWIYFTHTILWATSHYQGDT